MSELLLGSSHVDSNEQFQLPDGGMVGTGCILVSRRSTKADRNFAYSASRFG